MATDDDNFDIDIYGDGTYNANEPGAQEDSELVLDAPENLPHSNAGASNNTQSNANNQAANIKHEDKSPTQDQPAGNAAAQQANQQQAPNNGLPAAPQGIKRKEYEDQSADIDANATTALMISDLTWWTTEDDIRGWINHAGAEDQLKDVTFSEHKVNGKSKG